MKLYFKSMRKGRLVYTAHDGMPEDVVLGLLQDLGHEEIEPITEEQFAAATQEEHQGE